jgi:DNA-binding NtrC family response regulator
MSNILVIDDDNAICQLLQQGLESLGHHVSVANDGKKGLAAHKAAPAQLVITDLIMPGMEGIETIIEMRRRSPSLKIIAMSGGGMGKGTDYLQIAQKFGAHGTITKPFTLRKLGQLVTEVMGETPAG